MKERTVDKKNPSGEGPRDGCSADMSFQERNAFKRDMCWKVTNLLCSCDEGPRDPRMPRMKRAQCPAPHPKFSRSPCSDGAKRRSGCVIFDLSPHRAGRGRHAAPGEGPGTA